MAAAMPNWATLTAYALVFCATLLFADFAMGTISARRSKQAVNRRLGLIAAGKSRVEVMQLLRPQRRGATRGSLLGPVVRWIEPKLTQAGMRISAQRMLAMMAIASASIGVAFPLAAQLTTQFNSLSTLLLLAIFAIGVGFAMPIFYLNMRAAKRIKEFDRQFPVALDIFVRGLRAGHPVSAALDLLTTEMADPSGSEFGIVIDEVNYGLDLREALTNLSNRIGSQDVQMFVVCVAIQNETGGNLAEILEGLTKVIRERMGMVMKVKALASEGKMIGTMLSILPLFTFTVVFTSSPEFYLDVAGDPWFMPGVGIILSLYTLGILTIRKLVDLKV
ncbi:type II secretion system F family protein [Polymorphobacter sp. PAMC 29334]|uniref:type II secretion system F family protein n=1 Tax=Polymorphobacter sp. PAMC 29334 TaxID=2862331 RepID=UPI001C77A9D7|nr:type II secretion system F family protein [Polymorphobacter sp. PAMC 29334]QYE36583.1 type II secretion system F family protein [Polymorphobacter sp. PAMC 29334]